MRFFHDPAVQRTLFASVCLYLVTLVICLLLRSTILVAVALSAYIITPLLLSVTLARFSSVPRSLEILFRQMFLWLLSTIVILTTVLYVVTDLWNPDHFFYTLGVPPLHMKLLLLLTLQLPWIAAAVPLGFLPLLFRVKQTPQVATAAAKQA